MSSHYKNSFLHILPHICQSYCILNLTETFKSQLKFHIYFILESWSNDRYNYPKRVSECETEKEKYAENIGRDQNRTRRISKEGGKTGERKEGERKREIETERGSEREREIC